MALIFQKKLTTAIEVYFGRADADPRNSSGNRDCGWACLLDIRRSGVLDCSILLTITWAYVYNKHIACNHLFCMV